MLPHGLEGRLEMHLGVQVLILCKACRARGQIRHFRNEKGSGAEMCAVIHSGIVARHRAGQLLANFFHVLNNSPRSLRLTQRSFFLASKVVD